MVGMGRVYEIVDLYQILLVNPPLRIMVIYPYFWTVSAPTHAKIPKTQYFDGISILMAGMGRVYEIVDLYQILLVNPPLQIIAIYHIFGRYPPPPMQKPQQTQYDGGDGAGL
ncbi:MAG: hypothetical protein EAZ59_08400 [Oscillatoriales cyanobacterium]|nr:MAG: hypothetical protein EAZ59_08400 [Oscillatoriales cyanobacterium]